ncbi:MAG: ATP-binding protein, partial [Anaerolineales bacterium]|nr:ATP-binding protein [Anaerolineales bacterium]
FTLHNEVMWADSTNVSLNASAKSGIHLQSDNDLNVHVDGDMIAGDYHYHYHEAQIPLICRFEAIPFSSNIKNFLYEYLGNDTRQVPFGGRDQELTQLQNWLDDDKAPTFGLLTASAGRGKSALLANWYQQLQAQGDVHTIYFPISIRFDTTLKIAFYQSVTVQLAKLHGRSLSQNISSEISEWKAEFDDLLQTSPPNGQRILLIVDGLDEATWEARADLFPRQLADNLRVFVSARFIEDDQDQEGWRKRLRWQQESTQTFDLSPLTQEGLADVLSKMGNPFDQLAADVEILTELLKLSEGDPLLVQLYVQALYTKAGDTIALTSEALHSLEPGLDGYFDQWWADQRRQWQTLYGTKNPMMESHVRLLFNLCATAEGPLSDDDLLALAPDVLDSVFTIEDTMQYLRRFIVINKHIGNHGETYPVFVFNHPRLNNYFWNKLKKPEKQRLAQRFHQYGRDLVKRLNEKLIESTEASPYLVQHFGAHLEKAETHSFYPTQETLYSLVSEGWFAAWEALEGTNTGFLHDVNRAWAMANKKRHIAMQIKCALCHASITTRTTNIPLSLLARLYKQGQMTAAQLLVTLDRYSNGSATRSYLEELAPLLPPQYHPQLLGLARSPTKLSERCFSLLALAPYLPKPQQQEIQQEILQTATLVPQEHERAEILAALAPQMPEPQQTALYQEALQIAQHIPDIKFRTHRLSNLLHQLPDILQANVVQEVLQTARQIQDDTARAIQLIKLIPFLPESQQYEIFSETSEAIMDIPNDGTYVTCFIDLISSTASPQQAEGYQEALRMARLIADDYGRADTLRCLAPHLPRPQQDEIYEEILQTLDLVESADQRLLVFQELTPHLHAHQLMEAFHRLFQNQEDRVFALYSIIPYLPGKELEKALQIAQRIQDESSQASMLIELAANLTQPYQDTVYEAAWQKAKIVHDERIRGTLVSKLMPFIPNEELVRATKFIQDESIRVSLLGDLATHASSEELLQIARQLQDEGHQCQLFLAVAPKLSQERRNSIYQEALQIIQGLQDDFSRALYLAEIAPHLPKHQQAKRYDEALKSLKHIQPEFKRSIVLHSLTHRLPQPLLQAEASQIVQSFQSAYYRVEALHYLAPYLPPKHQTTSYHEAYQLSKQIEPDMFRVKALVPLVPHLPQELLAEALHNGSLEHELTRVELLSALAPYLSEPLIAEAWEIAQAFESKLHRTLALAVLSPHLPKSQRHKSYKDILQTAAHLETDYDRARVLEMLIHGGIDDNMPVSSLIQALKSTHSPTLWLKIRQSNAFVRGVLTNDYAYENWQELLRHLLQYSRKDFLDVVGYWCSLGLAFVNEDKQNTEGIKIAKAVQQVCQWFP